MKKGRYAKFWSQFDTVKEGARRNGVFLAVWPPNAQDDWDIEPEYVYEDRWVLMDEHAHADDSLHRYLGTDKAASTNDGPVKRVPLRDPQRDPMPDVVERIKRRPANDTTPNHLMSICDVNMCPADEPFPMPANAELWPSQEPGDGGAGVDIRVIDTGLVKCHEEIPLLSQNVTGNLNTLIDYRAERILTYGMHGSVIAGLIKSMAPKAVVEVTNALTMAGTALELDLGNALCEALAKRPDIISLSAGTLTQNRRELLGLNRFWTELQDNGHTLLVAAAGNEGTVQALMPAALGPSSGGAILSVGALRADCTGLACFSNWGPDVQVYAPGERLITLFTEGDYQYADPPVLHCRYHDPCLYCPCTCVTAPPEGAQVRFEGRARWSGTSFATPIVAGLVASCMKEFDLDPRSAARKLLQDKGFAFDLPLAHPALPQRTGLALIPASIGRHALTT